MTGGAQERRGSPAAGQAKIASPAIPERRVQSLCVLARRHHPACRAGDCSRAACATAPHAVSAIAPPPAVGSACRMAARVRGSAISMARQHHGTAASAHSQAMCQTDEWQCRDRLACRAQSRQSRQQRSSLPRRAFVAPRPLPQPSSRRCCASGEQRRTVQELDSASRRQLSLLAAAAAVVHATQRIVAVQAWRSARLRIEGSTDRCHDACAEQARVSETSHTARLSDPGCIGTTVRALFQHALRQCRGDAQACGPTWRQPWGGCGHVGSVVSRHFANKRCSRHSSSQR